MPRRVLASVCDPVIEVGAGVSGLPAVREDPPGAGPLVALLAGVGRVGRSRRCVLLACDLPFVEAPLLRLLVDRPGIGDRDPGGRRPLAVRVRGYGRAAFDEALAALRTRRAVAARRRRIGLRVPRRGRVGAVATALRSPTSTPPKTCTGSGLSLPSTPASGPRDRNS